MKRLFYLLLATFTLAGCQKSEESEIVTEKKSISFSAEELTRSEQKTSWATDDRVAIFDLQDGEDEPNSTAVPMEYKYNYYDFTAVDNSYYEGDATRFMLIYPYIEGYTYADYKAVEDINFSEIDIIKSDVAEVSNNSVNFTSFSHVYTGISFKIQYEDYTPIYSINYTLILTDGSDNELHSKEFEYVSSSNDGETLVELFTMFSMNNDPVVKGAKIVLSINDSELKYYTNEYDYTFTAGNYPIRPTTIPTL